MPLLREKRKKSHVSVYGVLGTENAVCVKVNSEVKVEQLIQQALEKANRREERVNDFVLVEEVWLGWQSNSSSGLGKQSHESDTPPTSQRLLDAEELVLEAKERWRGMGRFTLQRKGNDPSTRAWLTTLVREQKRRSSSHTISPFHTNASSSHLLSPSSSTESPPCSPGGYADWSSDHNMFLVCVYNVAPDLPYTILRAPHSSTAQDIVTQALMKTHRVADPRDFVLVEEVSLANSVSHSNTVSRGNAANSGSSPGAYTRRVLWDAENVYAIQRAWQTNAGKFMLQDRAAAVPGSCPEHRRILLRQGSKSKLVRQNATTKKERKYGEGSTRLARPHSFPKKYEEFPEILCDIGLRFRESLDT